jgi:hypothetical protein
MKQRNRVTPFGTRTSKNSAQPRLLDLLHCVEHHDLWLLHGATAASLGWSGLPPWRRWLKDRALHQPQRAAGGNRGAAPGATGPWQSRPACLPRAALPNPSLKRSVNGLAPTRRRPLSSNVRPRTVSEQQSHQRFEQAPFEPCPSSRPPPVAVRAVSRTSDAPGVESVVHRGSTLVPAKAASTARVQSTCAAWPNPSLKRSVNGLPPGPRGSRAYHLPRGPGANPSPSA